MSMKETWYDIDGFEGLYQWSDNLRFRSTDRIVKNGKDSTRNHKGKILDLTLGGSGYPVVALWKENKQYKIYVHVFFAKEYIPNPENKQCVNHKNGNKKDYTPSNLEWATKSEDLQHAYDTGLRTRRIGEANRNYGKPGKRRGNHPKAKLVLDTQTGIFYDCLLDATDAKCLNYQSTRAQISGAMNNNTSLIYA